jgi:hypothetical protein
MISIVNSVATSQDFLRTTKAGGMTLTVYDVETMKLLAYDPSCLLLQPSTSYSTVTDRPEVHPGGRSSLRSKARKGTSEFERNYPW